MQFNLVVTGLDSVEARRWMNATLVGMVDPENPESMKPMIDGGTEGEPRLVFRAPRPEANDPFFVGPLRLQGPSDRYPAVHLSLLRVHSSSQLHGPRVVLVSSLTSSPSCFSSTCTRLRPLSPFVPSPTPPVYPSTASNGRPSSTGPRPSPVRPARLELYRV